MDAIILAAGNSRRFGSNKLLHEMNGKRMYQYAKEMLEELQKEGCLERVIMVTQYREIVEELRREESGIHVVFNGEPDLGISHSIFLGLKELEKSVPDSEGCLFTVADQPYMRLESVRGVIAAWRDGRGSAAEAGRESTVEAGRDSTAEAGSAKPRQNKKGIAVCACGEVIGNPVIFSRNYYPELAALRGDKGGKRIVMRHLEDTILFPVEEQELKDVDVPEELVNFLRYVENSTDAYVDTTSSRSLWALHERITRLKKSREWEGRYMKFEELLRDAEKKGGKRMQDRLLSLMDHMVAAGETDQLQRLNQEPEFLSEMLKKYHL